MGEPTDMLVVVATMYENPQGLTKEEVLNKFDKIKLRSPLGIGDKLNSGLYGFSSLFNLERNKKYLENRKKYWNKEYRYSSKRELIWTEKYLKVIHTKHKSLGETILEFEGYDSYDFREPKSQKKGDYLGIDYFDKLKIDKKYENSENRYLIKKVLRENIEKYDEDCVGKIFQKLKVEVVQFKSKTFKFDSFEKLWKKYPEYHPKRIYNFNQETGFIYPHEYYGMPIKILSFKWIKKGNKYFLDFDNFSKIINANSCFGKNDKWKHKNRGNKSPYSLTDVILTSESIKRKNWRKLGYNAFFRDNENFIYGNEKTFRRYEQAVLETELVVESQKNGWTNSEFLREHHSRISNRNQVPYEDIKKMLKQENKQRGIKKRKNTIRCKKEEKERKEKELELPF